MLRLGTDPEKLYRATFICQDGLCCGNMALISFRLVRKNLGNLRDFLGKWFTAPPGKKIPVRLCSASLILCTPESMTANPNSFRGMKKLLVITVS